MQDDAVLNVINRYWNQLNEDVRILLQRFDAETADENESKSITNQEKVIRFHVLISCLKIRWKWGHHILPCLTFYLGQGWTWWKACKPSTCFAASCSKINSSVWQTTPEKWKSYPGSKRRVRWQSVNFRYWSHRISDYKNFYSQQVKLPIWKKPLNKSMLKFKLKIATSTYSTLHSMKRTIRSLWR